VDGIVVVGGRLTTLEQQNGDLAQVKVDKVSRFMGDVAAKVATDYTMPGWVVLFVELLLDESCNVLCGDGDGEKKARKLNQKAVVVENFDRKKIVQGLSSPKLGSIVFLLFLPYCQFMLMYGAAKAKRTRGCVGRV
jgi:hypothetical protein